MSFSSRLYCRGHRVLISIHEREKQELSAGDNMRPADENEESRATSCWKYTVNILSDHRQELGVYTDIRPFPTAPCPAARVSFVLPQTLRTLGSGWQQAECLISEILTILTFHVTVHQRQTHLAGSPATLIPDLVSCLERFGRLYWTKFTALWVCCPDSRMCLKSCVLF